MKTETGDKVRLKTPEHAGERGIVHEMDGEKLVVRLEQSGQVVHVLPEQVTNFSLAARKAWKTEPNRGVGRKKGTKLCDRLSVIFRIDRELWDRFVALENRGVIDDRTAMINRWFREKLAELAGEEHQSGCPNE